MAHDLSPDPGTPDTSARRLRAAALVIYVTLVLLAITIPQSVVNWLRDMNGNPVQETALRVAEPLQKLSQQTGIAVPYTRARAFFLALVGKESD
jgi:hypothetical protein